jgi:predicted transcriptional regulator
MSEATFDRSKRTYPHEDIKMQEWYNVRRAAISFHGESCKRCKTNTNKLVVHHTHYYDNKRAWEYELEELVPLCYACHDYEHAINRDQFFMVELALSNGWLLTASNRTTISKHTGFDPGKVTRYIGFMCDKGIFKKVKVDKNVFYELTGKHVFCYPYYKLDNPTKFEYTDEIDYLIHEEGFKILPDNKIRFSRSITGFEVIEDGKVRINVEPVKDFVEWKAIPVYKIKIDKPEIVYPKPEKRVVKYAPRKTTQFSYIMKEDLESMYRLGKLHKNSMTPSTLKGLLSRDYCQTENGEEYTLTPVGMEYLVNNAKYLFNQ